MVLAGRAPSLEVRRARRHAPARDCRSTASACAESASKTSSWATGCSSVWRNSSKTVLNATRLQLLDLYQKEGAGRLVNDHAINPMVPQAARRGSAFAARRMTPTPCRSPARLTTASCPALNPASSACSTPSAWGETPISISGDPAQERNGLTYTIRAVGAADPQARLRSKRGETIGVRGPFGRGWPVEEAKSPRRAAHRGRASAWPRCARWSTTSWRTAATTDAPSCSTGRARRATSSMPRRLSRWQTAARLPGACNGGPGGPRLDRLGRGRHTAALGA